MRDDEYKALSDESLAELGFGLGGLEEALAERVADLADDVAMYRASSQRNLDERVKAEATTTTLNGTLSNVSNEVVRVKQERDDARNRVVALLQERDDAISYGRELSAKLAEQAQVMNELRAEHADARDEIKEMTCRA